MRRVLAAALLLAPAGGRAAGAPASLCVAGEQPLFSCPLDARIVAVCGRAGHAEYRFGRPGHIALRAGGLGLAETAFAGGGETQITFARGDYRYIVYAMTVRTAVGADGRNDPQSSAGVVVQRRGRTVATMACGGAGDAAIATAAATFIPTVPFVRH